MRENRPWTEAEQPELIFCEDCRWFSDVQHEGIERAVCLHPNSAKDGRYLVYKCYSPLAWQERGFGMCSVKGLNFEETPKNTNSQAAHASKGENSND